MVTGPMGAGKSTFMRSLPKPWGNFIVPNKVPDMLLDYACELNNLMFYEIDAPTATGKVWIEWLRAADIQIVVVNGLDEPDNHFIELWNYLENNSPTTKKIIILNRVTEIKEKWKSYSDEKIFCVGIGEIINEETAMASKNDISRVLEYLNNDL
ncbi:uncharacterized protein METZ01_LOCUS113083 [marine metagenome]|uniref:G domain-containing protein n=1 Tax=marine metagenome TaxID=408172 RepID=A0A381X659_9ZZZZ